jgi:hypothetical protein
MENKTLKLTVEKHQFISLIREIGRMSHIDLAEDKQSGVISNEDGTKIAFTVHANSITFDVVDNPKNISLALIQRAMEAEEEVLLQLECVVDIDEDSERERIAKHIIDVLCEEGGTESAGQLCFPNFGTWDWEPRRLIRSDDGGLIDNREATLEFKIADARRSGELAEEAHALNRRRRHEVDIFTAWTMRKMEAGSSPAELTWERCVEALGTC